MVDDTTPLPEPGADVPVLAFDPYAGPGVPPGMEAGPAGSVVLLLVATSQRVWAADAAIELSSAWAEHGRRVVLADLHLESPVLHSQLGASNLEGMVDIFLYGASIARSARPVRGRGFYAVTAGTYSADADAVLHHPRWDKLAAGFRDASASLLLFTPAEASYVEALAPRAAQVVVLGDAERAAEVGAWVGGRSPIRAVLTPPSSPVPNPPEAPAAADAEPESPVSGPEARRNPDPHPAPPDRPDPGGRGGPWRALFWVLIAGVLIGGAGYLFARTWPDLSPGVRHAPAADSLAARAEPAAPVPRGEPLPYSVQVRAYTSLDAAREQLAAERARYPHAPFFLSPEEIQGILYYKIFAGVLSDSLEARALRRALVEAGAVDAEEAADSWSLIQRVPLSFGLGRVGSDAALANAVDSLRAHRVPVYPVPVPYSDGTRHWQLYAGAYRDSASAEAMRGLLGSAGLDPLLVVRSGAATAPAPAAEG